MIDRLGKLSCCAPNASWYHNCGRTGDSNFEHTWTEGFKACKHAAKLSLTTTVVNYRWTVRIQAKVVAATSIVCSKCAIDQLGKVSCCARTASWHKNCGRTGDSNFEHTWAEGFKACKHAERLSDKLNHMVINQTPTSQQINTVPNHSSVTSPYDIPAVSSATFDQPTFVVTVPSFFVMMYIAVLYTILLVMISNGNKF